jgi:hypothetical protein
VQSKTQPEITLLDETDVEYHDDYFQKNMTDYYDVQLFSTVYFGSNRQPFEMILDTGSAVRDFLPDR